MTPKSTEEPINPSTNPHKVQASIYNLNRAFARLSSFLADPIEDDRDRAGVIQAFEFTFELFWKTFQKIAELEGFAVKSPKQALKTAFQLDLIISQEENLWFNMIDDRNLMNHTYREDLSQAIFERIQQYYYPVFQNCLTRLQTRCQAP